MVFVHANQIITLVNALTFVSIEVILTWFNEVIINNTNIEVVYTNQAAR